MVVLGLSWRCMWWACCLFVSMLDGSGHFDGYFGSVMAVYVVGLLSDGERLMDEWQ